MFAKSMKMKNLNWIFIAVLLISAVLCAATSIHPASAQQTPTTLVFVNPSSSVFINPTVGTTFNVNVTIANVTDLAGAQFTLSWNASLLNCIGITENLFHTVTPSSDWSNIWSLALNYNNTAGTASYAQTWMSLTEAESDGSCPINVNMTTFPPDGSVALAVLTFNVTSVPGVNMFSECNFTLASPVKLGTSSVPPAVIANTIVNGNYEVYGPPLVTVAPVTNAWSGITDNVTTDLFYASLVPSSMAYDNSTYTLSFNVTGTAGTTAYVNVTAPTDIISLNQTTDQWKVTVNGTQVTPIISSNSTDTSFYVAVSFDQGIPITITGTIPELPMLMMIPLLATVMMFAVELRRRRRV
jgi:hypothetical protein